MPVSTIRIAATADLHVRMGDDLTDLQQALADVGELADVLLIAGDLVDIGRVAEMEALAEVLAESPIPVFAVLGNHDRRGMRKVAMTKVLRGAGVSVFDGSGAMVTMPDRPSLGIAGVTGTGGGFRPEGEEQGHSARFTKAAMHKSRRESAALRRALRELAEKQPDITVVMTHFAPTDSTMGTEPVLKYWMLGNAFSVARSTSSCRHSPCMAMRIWASNRDRRWPACRSAMSPCR